MRVGLIDMRYEGLQAVAALLACGWARLREMRLQAWQAGFSALWGLYLLLTPLFFDGRGLITRSPLLFQGMLDWTPRGMQPELLWGGAMCLIGLVRLVALASARKAVLALVEGAGAMLWTMVAAALIYPNPYTLAVVVYPLLALTSLWCALQAAKPGEP